MDNKNRYSTSKNAVLLVTFIISSIICLAFAFGRGRFDPYSLKLGIVFGGMFTLFPIIYGFGKSLEITHKEIAYYPNLFAKLFNKPSKKIALSKIEKVRLGIPRINRSMDTFAAINISGKDEEVSFNPDLFDGYTLQKMFRELKSKNPNIEFDKYSLNILKTGEDAGEFRNKVISNFIRTLLPFKKPDN